jgi:hypothetical protein
MSGASSEPIYFSWEELAKHDGSDGSLPLLICVQGMIFDVTPARSFYGPGVQTLSGLRLPIACIDVLSLARSRLSLCFQALLNIEPATAGFMQGSGKFAHAVMIMPCSRLRVCKRAQVHDNHHLRLGVLYERGMPTGD